MKSIMKVNNIMEDKYITVSQLSRYLKFKFDNDNNLANIFLKGEISNFKLHTRGHLYFTIKMKILVLMLLCLHLKQIN